MTLEEFDDEYLVKSTHKFIMLSTGQQLLNIDMKVVKYPLYRSMEKKWFNHMMKTGEIRVGTLWDFRDKVKYGDKIGDEDEGVRSCEIQTLYGKQLAFNANQDQFVLSCSANKQKSREIEDSYDVQFSINSIQFFVEIAESLTRIHTLDSIVVTPVVYCTSADIKAFAQAKYIRNSSNPYLQIFPAAGIKDASYASQNEVRAIFRLLKDPLAGKYPNTGDSWSQLAAVRAMKSEIGPTVVKAPKALNYITRL